MVTAICRLKEAGFLVQKKVDIDSRMASCCISMRKRSQFRYFGWDIFYLQKEIFEHGYIKTKQSQNTKKS